MEQAVYWTEYVIRHKGAPHLRSAVLDLNWYQYFLLDVIAVLALVFGTASTVTFFIVRAILRKLFFSASNTKSVSQNKKRN
jgi:glucuronosyltransferase